MAHYEEFFRKADVDNSGFLSIYELTAVLKKNGYKEDKIKAIFCSVDASGDRKISRDEFLVAMGQCSPKDHKAAQMRSVFQSFDRNCDGTISGSELDAVLRELGTRLTDAEMKRLVAKMDKDRSGAISYEEFVREIFG